MAANIDPLIEEPVTKRSKRDILLTFQDNEANSERLAEAFNMLDTNANGFCSLKVKYCNAKRPVSFTKCFCDVERNTEKADYDAREKYYLFDCIFEHGFKIVKRFIRYMALPSSKVERIALEQLLELFNDTSNWEKALTETVENETERMVRLAHHLLSKLAVNKDYIMDKHLAGTDLEQHMCRCCNEKIAGKFGDTSIGSTNVWHGDVDILLGLEPVPVLLSLEEPESPLGNASSFEINKRDRERALAKTIVFSYLTKKRHPEYSCFMTPSIVITKENIFIYFYDCENDVLLESSALPILSGTDKPLMSTILALWLTINYKHLCLKTPEVVKAGIKADFLTHIESISGIYEDDLVIGCGSVKSRPVKPFQPNISPWLDGIRSEPVE